MVSLEEIRLLASRIYIRCLPIRCRQFLCDVLDTESTLGTKDYRMLGEQFGCTHFHVQALRSNNNGRSVTAALLNEYQHQITIWHLIEILSRMGVCGIQEILDSWQEVLSLYYREQDQLFGQSRQGVQNAEGSCNCASCHKTPSHFINEHRGPVYPPGPGNICFGRYVPQDPVEWHNRPSHRQHYQEIDPRLPGHGLGLYNQMTDDFPENRPPPNSGGDGRKLVRQTAIDGTSMNILPGRLLRLISNEENYSNGLETDGDHGNPVVEFENTDQDIAVNRGGSQGQAGLTARKSLQSLNRSCVETTSLDGCSIPENPESANWIPPDSFSLISLTDEASINGEFEIVQDNPSQQASFAHSQKSMGDRECNTSHCNTNTSHGNSNMQMAHPGDNGNQVLTPKIAHNPLAEAYKASEILENNIIENSQATGYSMPPQGYSECHAHPQEQTLRKVPYSTTEGYYRQRYVENHHNPPSQMPFSCLGTDCGCNFYPNLDTSSMIGTNRHPHIDGTTFTVPPDINRIQPQDLYSHQTSPGPPLCVTAGSPPGPHVAYPVRPQEHPVCRPAVNQSTPDQRETGEGQVMTRKDQAARRDEFGKANRLSDPSPSPGNNETELHRHSSDDNIPYVYQREERPPKFVFITGGELEKQKIVADLIWKLCKYLHRNGLHVVADLQQGLVALPGDPLSLRRQQRENIHEATMEYFKKATCVLIIVSPGYKLYINKNNENPSPSEHRISTRFIYTEMMDEHCRKNFCKNKRFYPVKLTALKTKTRHIPDWMASTLIYTFPSKNDELIRHLTEDLSND